MTQRKRKKGEQRLTAQSSGRAAERRPDGLPVGRPFPEGVSGNPGGRPKTAHLSKVYREELQEPYPGDPAGRTYAQVIAAQILEAAARGDIGAVKEITDRVEGKARQSIEVTAGDALADENKSAEEYQAELEELLAARGLMLVKVEDAAGGAGQLDSGIREDSVAEQWLLGIGPESAEEALKSLYRAAAAGDLEAIKLYHDLRWGPAVRDQE